MSFSNENDPFQRIIDVSWQETGTRYAPTEESYNNDWPEDQNGHVLPRNAYRNGLYRYPKRDTCVPPPKIMRAIVREINKNKIYYDDKAAKIWASAAGIRLRGGKEEIINPTTQDGFYCFTDYRTKPTE